MSNLNTEQFGAPPSEKRFTVITQHGEARKVRRRRFGTFEEADTFAASNNPDTDGSMVPNVDDKFVNHPDYEKGHYWPNHENRYAVIHQKRR